MSFLEMSFSAAILILVISLLRRFFLNKLPKRLFLVLWGIVLFRLLVPVSVPSSLSIYTLIRRWDNGQEDIASGNQIKPPIGMPDIYPAVRCKAAAAYQRQSCMRERTYRRSRPGLP